MTTKRAKFEVRDFGRCVVLTQPNGRVREFHIPHTTSGTGYVREGSNMGQQVCDGLFRRGDTLTASDKNLLEVIRREWRVYKRSEQYECEQYMYEEIEN